MKYISAFSAVAGLSLTACDTMTRPISSGGFDPLSAPGGGSNLSSAMGPEFSAGQFVRAAMDNTAFFKNRPKGDADADKLLNRGTSMKVVSVSDSYTKVELDSGEVGYVPTVMLEDPNAAISAPAVNPNEFQVYPPIGGTYAAPLPPVTPGEMPPEGAIPTIIDPEAPSVVAPAEVPVVPQRESAPLPPNDEDLKEATPNVEAVPKLEN